MKSEGIVFKSPEGLLLKGQNAIEFYKKSKNGRITFTQ